MPHGMETLTEPQQIQDIVRQYLVDALEDDARRRARRGPAEDDELVDFGLMEELVGDHRSALTEGDLSIIEAEAEELVQQRGLRLTAPAYRQLAEELLKGMCLFLDIVLHRDQGDYEYEQRVLGRYGIEPQAPEAPPAGRRLSDLVREYIQEQTAVREWNARTVKEQHSILGTWVEILGDPELGAIDSAAMCRYMGVLRKLPANRHQDRRLADKSLDDVLRLPNLKPMAASTVRKHAGRVAAFCEWAAVRDHLPAGLGRALGASSRQGPGFGR